MSYTDSVSISLSTAYLFNYPMSSFARLPVSLTISLDLFESLASPCNSGYCAPAHVVFQITIAPPSPFSSKPVVTISFPSDFTLNLKTTSLMGSRAMLKDVPKLHELIENQVRRVFAARGTWKIDLPGLGNVAIPKEKGDSGDVDSTL